MGKVQKHWLDDVPIRIDDPIDPSDIHPLYRDRSDINACPIKSLFAKCKLEKRPFYVAAPMVRYSKLPFRALVRDYGCDLVYTPMILAKEFSRHHMARSSEFSSNSRDRPLVVQFAANDPVLLGRACELVMPYTDAIGLNCGCPQSWACQEGYGAHLMKDPQLVSELIKSAKSRCGQGLVMETKMRIHTDLRETVSWAQQMQMAGVEFLTVHGRTKNTRSSVPVNLDAIKLIKESVSIPVVANGDADNMDEVNKIAAYTGVDGVMSARGLFSNPALFAGYDKCPWSAIERFMGYAKAYDLHLALFQKHMTEMMSSGGYWRKKDRILFFEKRTYDDVFAFMKERYVVRDLGDADYGKIDECIKKFGAINAASIVEKSSVA